MLPSPLADVTPSSPTADVVQLRAHINEDLAALAESMRVLHSRWNSLAPISRLPNEILAIIFKLFEEEERFDGYVNNDIPACRTITHVCRHWRKVALECPALWTYICSSSPHWLEIMFERSKNAPLVVKYEYPVVLQACLEQVLSQLIRIKYLEFCTLSFDVGRAMDLLSSQPAPMLQTFKFLVTFNGHPRRHISHTIFQGRAPLLRNVEVEHCDRSWSSCIFGGLRTLRVRGTLLLDLLGALRCMPALEWLMLESLTFDETMLFNKVPLARLKSIALYDTSLPTAVSLFAHLTLPVDVKIALYLSSIEGPQTFSDLFSAMDNHPGESGPALRSMRAIKYKARDFAIQFSTSPAINSEYYWNPEDDDDIRLSIQFFYGLSAEVQPNIVFDICQIVTERRSQTFFSGDLEFIHVKGTSDFIGSLTAALRVDGSSNIAYPSLRVLELRGIEFTADELRDLWDVLTMRAERNVGIHDLRLTICDNFTVDHVELFGAVVVNTVDCDQYTLGSRPSAWRGQSPSRF